MTSGKNGSEYRKLIAYTSGVLLTAALLPANAWGICESAQLPAASCPAPPPPFAIQLPPATSLPPGAPDATPVCGTCVQEESAPVCFSAEDCLSGPCTYQPVCPPTGPCHIPEPESMAYVDIRCFRPQPPDDTCRLKRALATATGRALWIPADVTLAISPNGEDAGDCAAPLDIIPHTTPDVPLYGVAIPSYTTVTGGGTVRLRVGMPTPAGFICDPSNPHPTEEGCQNGHLFKIKDAAGITISGIRFDHSALELGCPDKGFYPGACEHRHAVSIRGDSTDITIENCSFVNLVGDGVYIADTADEGGTRHTPARVVVRNNGFSAEPSRRNRNGVSVGAVRDLRIEANHFEEMGRGYFLDPCDPACSVSPNCAAENRICPIPMPGAIDLEPDVAAQTIERVQIVRNDIVGWAAPADRACLNQAGISVSNHVNATIRDVLVDDNDIQGCEQSGILVSGSGTAARPIVVTNNTVHTTRPHPDIANRWGILVVGNVAGTAHVPSFAHVAGNTVQGDGGVESDGDSMVGIFVASTQSVVAGNTVIGARRQGIFFDERHADGVRFMTPNVFCGNLLCDNGTLAHESAMTLWGGYHRVVDNRIESSPRGISVLWGAVNEFTANSVADVAACDSPSFGCIFCEGSAGCQRFLANDVPGNLTNCSPCGGGSGGRPRRIFAAQQD